MDISLYNTLQLNILGDGIFTWTESFFGKWAVYSSTAFKSKQIQPSVLIIQRIVAMEEIYGAIPKQHQPQEF